MKIAVDSGPLSSGHGFRGIGTYVRELSKNLENVELADFSSDFKTISSNFDLLHFTSFNPYTVSLPHFKPKGKFYILTIYDLIPLIYPGSYPPGIRGKINWEINKILIRKNANAVITISETSKKDICRFAGINPDKVHVTYLAAGSVFKKLEVRNSDLEITERFSLPEHFALYVGDVNYNKNIPNLIKACRLAKTPLVMAGKQAKEIENLELNHPELAHLKNLDWSGVIRLGYVADNDLAKIFNLAAVYVQPSFYEGFGLPVLEAISCGTPVAVSKTQCNVEILGDDFDFFDPKDVRSMAEAIGNPNKKKKLPRNYSWEKTAEETMNIYNSILKRKP